MCPVCRTKTCLPSKARATHKAEWASTFPSNHIIVSLIDKAMIDKQKKPCDPCTVMKTEVQASHWCVQCSEAYCDSCTRLHVAMKATRKHKMVGLQDVLGDLKCLSSDEMCNEHADEVIKLYCVDHDHPCCTICGATSHRKCDTVLELSEAALDIKNKKEFSDLLEGLTECESDIGKTTKSLQENLTILSKEKLHIERRAKGLADALVLHTKTLHDRFLKELSEAHSRAENEIKANAEKNTLQQKMITNSRQMLEKSRDHSSDSELFLQMKRTQKKCEEGKIFVQNEISKMTLKQLTHTFSGALSEFQSLKSFGDVKLSNMNNLTVMPKQSRQTIFAKAFLDYEKSMTRSKSTNS